ncbi:MAG: carotenoid oxygenase family protein [Bryobacteraceae bacterium]
MSQSKYQLGFTSLDRETSVNELPVRGNVPLWLVGTLVRTGPAKFEVGRNNYNHWFDGLAMLHRFGFSEGRVFYTNRFLRSRSYEEAIGAGRISRSEFATDPCRSLFGRVAAFFRPRLTDNANVSINKIGDEVVALTETPLPIRFDPSTLETLGVIEYQSEVRGQISIAHPHLDFRRRCSYSYVLKFGRRSEYRVFRTAWDVDRQNVICAIPVDKPAYMHSIGMTERYLIVAEFPLVVDPLRLKFSGKPFIQNYGWQKNRGVRFHIVEKDSGRVIARPESEPFFSFHHVNAFEEDGQVVVDLAAYSDARVIDQLYLSRLRSDQPVNATAKLTRFRVHLSGSNEVRSRVISDVPIELPRIDYRRRAGRPYRIVYGAGNQRSGDFIDNIVRIDVQTGAFVTWFEDGCYPGEPVFVASPDANVEDEGVLLSVVLDGNRQRSFLLVLDAGNLTELARAEAPHHIPFGFHGNYLASASGPESYRDLHR